MNDFILEKVIPVFQYNNLNDFEDFWKLKAEWFEAPNERRGGWSGVFRIDLKSPDNNNNFGIFIKRQENHTTRTWKHPLNGILTLEREFRNLQLLCKNGIPSLDVLFFGKRENKRSRRAILVTMELKGYISLHSIMQQWHESGKSGIQKHDIMLHKIVDVIKKLHENHIQHNCLYSKHLFIDQSLVENKYKNNGSNADPVKLIDLEKAKIRPFKSQCILRDLYTLNRHTHHLDIKNRLRFFKLYTGCKYLFKKEKKLLNRIITYKD